MKNLSRRALALLLCVAMLAGYLSFVPSAVEPITAEAATAPANPNLLANNNPDFEQTDEVEGWTVSSKTAVFLSDSVVKTGKLALKIKDSNNKGVHYARSGKIDVAAGIVYYAAVDVNGTTHGVVTLRFYDSNGNEMTAATATKTTATANSKWQNLQIKTTAPEGAVKADVELSTTAAGVGAVYFDNAVLYAEPGPSKVEQSSFEGTFNSADGLPEGWTFAWGGKTTMRQLNTDPNYVKTGKQSVKYVPNIGADGKSGTFGITSSQIDAIPGSRYAFDIWVKSEPFTADYSTCYVYVTFYNLHGQKLQKTGAILEGNGFTESYKVDVTTEWQNVHSAFVAPAGATKASVSFMTCSATRAPVYFDDLTLELDKSVPVLENPNFENGLESNGIPKGWKTYGGSTSDVTLVTDKKTNGTYGVKIDNTSSKIHSGITVSLPVREGEEWKLSADVIGNVQVYLLYNGSAGRVSTHTAKATGDTTKWQHVETTALAEATNTGTPTTMQILIYISQSTPSVAYVDNLKLECTKTAEFPTYTNQTTNGGFEKRKAVTGWSNMSFDYIQTDEKAGGDRGNFVVKFVDKREDAGAQFVTPQYPCTPGKYYYGLVDCITDSQVQIYIRFYDKDGKRITPSTFRTIDNTNGEWVQAGSLSRAPDNAAKVEMLFGTTVRALGTSYCDNLYLGEYNVEKDPDIEGMNSVKSPGWDDVNFNEVGHPRVFFTEDELAKLRKSVSYGFENDLGYSIRDSYMQLLEDANEYVDEKSFRMAWSGGIQMIYNLDEFRDINTYDEIKEAPPGFEEGVYPYFTHIGEQLQTRIQTLALAYAISQKEEYGQRAVHYVMKLCDWQIWSQADAIKSSATDMGCSYVTNAAAIVYDMCYDLLTDAQRVKLYTNIVEKGLKPLSRDVEALTNHNVWLARVNGIMIAASAIIEESNRELVEPYLTIGYRYSEWYLDELYESGWQEGFSYTDHALESVITGIDAIGRATGKEGFMDHPYFEEIMLDWLIYGMAPGSGKSPAFSDSTYAHYFFKTCMLLNKTTGSEKAGFYLKESGILETASIFEMLVYSSPEPKVAERKDLYQTTTVVDEIGYGYLRSGWDALDVNLTMVANQSKHGHNHYDQNAINIAFNSMNMVSDFGYASLAGSHSAPGYVFGYWNGHNTIFVDGETQNVLGAGQMTEVLGNTLYGQITGEAADAYGGRLNQFDRHAILVNHWDKPYYVIIDELDSNTEHVYNWNLYTQGWNGLQFEDKAVDVGSSAVINQFAVTKDRDAMFVTIVNNGGLNVRAFTTLDTYPVIQIDSPKTKTHQFMTIISMEEEVCKDAVIDFNSLFRGYLYGQTNTETDKVLWSTSYKGGSEVIKKVTVEGNDCVFFRGAAVGDFYELTYEVETAGTYNVKLSMPMSPNYGNFKIYIDGVAYEKIYNGYGASVRMTNYDVGLMDVTAGKHTIRLEVVGRDSRSDDYLISCGGVILSDPNKPAAVSTLNVTETYDDANVLGATVRYGTVLKDVILHNRGNGTISAGGVTTDGAQAAVMGIYENEITQGFSVTSATSMKFGETVLMTATAPVSVAVDYRAVKKQIQNTEQYVEEYPEEEDINRAIPTTYVTTNAAAACAVTLNIGKDAPYTATIDGNPVEVTYSEGFLTINVPAGNHDVKIVGTHTCVFDQKVEKIAHLKARATCEAPAQYYYSCLCEANGTECFQSGEPNGHRWGSAKVQTPATCSTEGAMVSKCRNCNMMQSEPIPTISHQLVKDGMFWGCTVCGGYYANAAGTMTVNTFITIVSISAGAFVLLAGGTITLLIIMKKRKRAAKANEETPTEENAQVSDEQTE